MNKKPNIRVIQKAAKDLLNEAGLVFNLKELNQQIKDTANQMISLNMDPYDDFDGPAGIASSLTAEQNLHNLSEFALRSSPMLFALSMLSKLKSFSSVYEGYDETTKKSHYSKPAALNRENIRVFLMSRAGYWFMNEEAAKEGIALLGFDEENLKPNKADYLRVELAMEEIAEAMYLPGIYQSQKNWSKKGAKDALEHKINKRGYSTGFKGKGLSDETWNVVSGEPWSILANAAACRSLFENSKAALKSSLYSALRGYLCGNPTSEFIMLNEEECRLKDPDAKVENPDGVLYRGPSDYYLESNRAAWAMRKQLLEQSHSLS